MVCPPAVSIKQEAFAIQPHSLSNITTPLTLYIKNMVCPRCIMVVTDILRKMGLQPQEVCLGRADLALTPSSEQLKQLEAELQSVGFELMHDNLSKTVDAIKLQVHHFILNPYSTSQPLSVVLAEKLGIDYNTLSRTFSAQEGRTIESYTIGLRIERAKELMLHSDKNMKQIAFDLGYSSIAHFSRQFKQITGKTPTAYRMDAPSYPQRRSK